jgi:hypothetical protein
MTVLRSTSPPRAPAAGGVVLLFWALFAGGTACAEPKLELRPENLDFGAIKQGEKLRKTIRVRNAGDADLVISLVRASCTECVVDKINGKTLKPGEEIQLPVTYDATAVPGKHPAYLTFHTNDPDDNGLKRLQIAVEIVARAAPALEFEPASINLGIFSFENGVECAVRLKNSGDAPLKFEEFSASPGITIAAKPNEIAAGKQEALKLTIAPKEAGILQSHVTIATNDPRNPVATIPIRGYAASHEQLEGALEGIVLLPERDTAHGGALRLVIFNHSAVAVTVWLTDIKDAAPVVVEPRKPVVISPPPNAPSEGPLRIEIAIPRTETEKAPTERR